MKQKKDDRKYRDVLHGDGKGLRDCRDRREKRGK